MYKNLIIKPDSWYWENFPTLAVALEKLPPQDSVVAVYTYSPDDKLVSTKNYAELEALHG